VSTLTSPDTIAFPLSPEYLTGPEWGPAEGVREIIANALDEDSKPRIEFVGDWLEIDDSGPGLPRAGLVLGVSRDNRTGQRKAADQIGQFGEGLAVGCLVLARAGIPMRVDTVGYSLEPRIAASEQLGADVLHLDFLAGDPDRAQGTPVRIRCSKKIAKKAISYFLSLADPDYRPATGAGRVIDSLRGRVYLGGVFVQERKDLHFSYDLALDGTAKYLQNRDRSVVDGYQLDRAITSCLGSLDDEKLIEILARRAVSGRLSKSERVFLGYLRLDPNVIRAWTRVGKRMFANEKTMWVAAGNDEIALDLRDRGFTVIEPKIDRRHYRALMNLLGVKEAKQTAKRIANKKHDKSQTTWTAAEDLTAEDHRILDLIMTACRRAFGEHCFGHGGVRVFDEHVPAAGQVGEMSWGGFYDSGPDLIAIKRSVLRQGLAATGSIIGHELGHRLRRSENTYDYSDRTRGFEGKLSDMLGALLEMLTEQNAGPAGAPSGPTNLELPPQRMRALLRTRMTDLGFKTQVALAEASGLSASMIGGVLSGNRGAMRPQIRYVQALADALGLHWPVLYLALSPPLIAAGARRNNGLLYGHCYAAVTQATAALRELGGSYAEPAAIIDDHACWRDRDLPFDRRASSIDPRRDRNWLTPYHKLINLEIAHVANS
jgi:transcriptional regulator with XRE-family HTH domain